MCKITGRQAVRRTGGVRWRGDDWHPPITQAEETHPPTQHVDLGSKEGLGERESSFRLCELSPGQEHRLDPQLCLLNNSAEI